MKEGRRSRTAERVAVRRAAHQLVDEPKIFTDPLALSILGHEQATALREALSDERSEFARHARAYMAIRSRLTEDLLANEVGRGTTQYVVLGAGLDTFAYRNPYPHLRVFEVDYPASQAWKRERLSAAAIPIPASLTFAPVDFERQTLAEGLADAGWRHDIPTFFSWLGVTMYLTEDAIDHTLRFVAATPAGSGIVFDYSISPSLLGMTHKAVYYYLAARVAAAGEPWRTTYDPASLVPHLRALGFSRIEDFTAEQINAQYFSGRADGLKVSGLAHLIGAWVPATTALAR